MKKVVIGGAIWLLAIPLLSWADPGPLFGPEFTFPAPTTDYTDRLITRMENHLVEGQPEGAKFIHRTRDTFQSPNGWKFQVGNDPGVAEVRMPPMTVDEYAMYARDIQDAIFVSAYNENMFPAHYLGGGHINVDVNYFLDKPPMLLRNFFVDRINHSELSMGIFGYDTHNAISFSMHDEVRAAIVKVIADFDNGVFGSTTKPSPETVHQFIRTLAATMTHAQDMFAEKWNYTGIRDYNYDGWALRYDINDDNPSDRLAKQFEISLVDCCGDDPNGNRIELRAVRPQASFDVWLHQIALIRDRIFYLQKAYGKRPLSLRASFAIPVGANPLDYTLDPPIPAETAFRSFYLYLDETGHDWRDHRDYLWPKWMQRPGANELSDLEKFEASSWFQCRQLLKKKAA